MDDGFKLCFLNFIAHGKKVVVYREVKDLVTDLVDSIINYGKDIQSDIILNEKIWRIVYGYIPLDIVLPIVVNYMSQSEASKMRVVCKKYTYHNYNYLADCEITRYDLYKITKIPILFLEQQVDQHGKQLKLDLTKNDLSLKKRVQTAEYQYMFTFMHTINLSGMTLDKLYIPANIHTLNLNNARINSVEIQNVHDLYMKSCRVRKLKVKSIYHLNIKEGLVQNKFPSNKRDHIYFTDIHQLIDNLSDAVHTIKELIVAVDKDDIIIFPTQGLTRLEVTANDFNLYKDLVNYAHKIKVTNIIVEFEPIVGNANNAITIIPSEGIEDFYIGGYFKTVLSYKKIKQLRMNCYDKIPFTLDGLDVSNMHTLILSGQISDLSALENCGLIKLIIRSRSDPINITAVGTLSKLRYADFSYTRIESVEPLSKCESLEELTLACCLVPNVDSLAKLKNLIALDISYTKVTDITPLSSIKSLKYLNIGDGKVRNISKLTNLSYLIGLPSDKTQWEHFQPDKLLYLDMTTGEKDIDLSKFSNLRALKLSAPNLTSLKNIPPQLKYLDLFIKEQISFDPLKKFHNLVCLKLEAMDIKNLSALSELCNLKILSMYNVYVEDMSMLKQHFWCIVLNFMRVKLPYGFDKVDTKRLSIAMGSIKSIRVPKIAHYGTINFTTYLNNCIDFKFKTIKQ